MNQKKINILSINTTGLGFGGDETRLLNQCRLLNKELFNCIVCTRERSAEGTMIPHFLAAGVEVIFMKVFPADPLTLTAPAAYLVRAINSIMYLAQIVKIAYSRKIDIIDGRLLEGGFLGIILKKIVNRPVIVTIYHVDKSKTVFKRLAGYLLRYSDVIICDSIFKTAEIRDWVGSKNQDFLVIPSAIDVKFSTDMDMAKIKADNISSGKIIIGQISRLVPHKGQDLLIRAFSNIVQKHDNIELWIVGFIRGREYYDHLVDLVKSYQLEEKVRFIEYPGFIGDIFKTIDIQVHPTRKDSLPNCILEGMSIGTSLISSSIAGIPEMVSHRETGLLFDIDAPEELTNCIDELLTDPAFRKRLGKAAKERFDTHFSPESLTAKLEDTFIRTLNKNLQTL